MAYIGKSPSQGVRNRYYFTASGGETSISGALTGGTLTFTDGNYVDVTLNGVTLVAGTDYNTSTANTIAGLSALTANDVVEIVVYDVFSVFSGNVNSDFSVGGNVTVTGTVDGRDVATDGTKLDGIEALADVTDATNVAAAGAAMLTGANFTGNVDVTGNVTSDGLTVNKGSAGTLATFTDGVNSNFVVETASLITTVGNTGGSTALAFKSANTERMRIDSSGSVGIGTAPAGGVQLDVRGTGVLQLVNTDTVQLLASNGGSTLKNVSNNPLIFGTNNTERMRLDASGNLLVGTTDSFPGDGDTNTGIALAASGSAAFSRDGFRVVSVNRNSSDGTLVEFNKDGSEVGSIGALSGNFYVAGSAKGLRVGSSSVVPATNSGSDSDNAIDLGYASSRFKDLYLSGGVYLGGTGSANELSDYEEGIFTPNLVGDSGEATYTGRHGTYTKIGRVVTVNIMMDISSVNTISGTVFINTLPFAVASVLDNTSLEASGIVGFFAGLNTSVSSLSCFAFEGTVNAGFYKVTGTSSTSMSILTASDITNSFDFRASLTYFTNA